MIFTFKNRCQSLRCGGEGARVDNLKIFIKLIPKILKILITSTFFLRLDFFQVNFAASSDGINQQKQHKTNPVNNSNCYQHLKPTKQVRVLR